jgi:carotene isomerase
VNSEVDVVIIGSGIAGLSCAALLAKYGFQVTVCESHTIPGGAAHSFERKGFKFDSGPSLHSGLSYRPSSNPLKHVLDAIGEELPCINYNTWGCYLPEGDFDAKVGADHFCEILTQFRGQQAVTEWRELQRIMRPLSEAATALPSAALRFDWGAPLTVGRFAPALLYHAPNMMKLTGSFSQVMGEVVRDPFIRNWLDLLCFLLSGLPASGTIAAEMAFMFAEWYKPGVVLDYPVGGSGAIVDTLVRGLDRHGGNLLLGTHVEQIIIEGQRAVGVQLRNGKTIRTRKAVVSNASVWDTLKLLPAGALPQKFQVQRETIPPCDSFMHLHLGIDATGIRSDLSCHYIVVNDWEMGINAPQNVVVISIPSVLDSSLAPPGKHTIHVYTPGNEPYALWIGLDRSSDQYKQQKEARAAVMWQAIERVIPDIRARCEVTMVGTPLTHERFLRRHKGSYGPAIQAGTGLFPGPGSPIPGLLCCGDSTFPGIGIPAVAASGMIAANTLAPIDRHLTMLKDIDF